MAAARDRLAQRGSSVALGLALRVAVTPSGSLASAGSAVTFSHFGSSLVVSGSFSLTLDEVVAP